MMAVITEGLLMMLLWTLLRLAAVVLTCWAVAAITQSQGLGTALVVMFLLLPVGWLGVVAAWGLWSDLTLASALADRRDSALNPALQRLIERDVAVRRAVAQREQERLQQRDRVLDALHRDNRARAAAGAPVRHVPAQARPIAVLAAEVRGPDERAVLRGEAVAALPDLAPNGEGALAPLDMPIRVALHRDERRMRRG